MDKTFLGLTRKDMDDYIGGSRLQNMKCNKYSLGGSLVLALFVFYQFCPHVNEHYIEVIYFIVYHPLTPLKWCNHS